jgi:hypothetical protein
MPNNESGASLAQSQPFSPAEEIAARRSVRSLVGEGEAAEVEAALALLEERPCPDGFGSTRQEWMDGNPAGGLGEPLIHKAARAWHLDTVELLLKKGANPLARTNDGPSVWEATSDSADRKTPREELSGLLGDLLDLGVPFAEADGSLVSVRSSGARRLQGKRHETVLERALQEEAFGFALRLLEMGALAATQEDPSDLALLSVLSTSAVEDEEGLCKIFAKLAELAGPAILDGAGPLFARETANNPAPKGSTALMACAYHGLPQCAQILVELGADYEKKNDQGEDALAVATRFGAGLVHSAIVDAVAERRAKEESAALREALAGQGAGAGERAVDPLSTRAAARL